jgi:GT2 family glycosyltransferase
LLRGSLHDSYFYGDRSFQNEEEIEQAGASFSLFQREVLDRIGGLFDERFPLLFNDVDLYRRIKDFGVSSHVVPSIRVVHLGGVSSRKFEAAEYQRLQYHGMFEYFRKHHPLQYPILCLAWPRWWLRNRRPASDTVGTR